ncbi:MAG: hypothetical protein ACXABI_14085 [Candidatus Hodarchaeales archaeon]|jgi:hypothetical protein
MHYHLNLSTNQKQIIVSLLLLFFFLHYSIDSGSGETTNTLTPCPFQTGDHIRFSIEGSWQGENSEINNGTLSGYLILDFLSRNDTHLLMYEEKIETISGEYNYTEINLYNNPSSFWLFNPQTRKHVLLPTYAWMWLSPQEFILESTVTIFNYEFAFQEYLDYSYANDSRTGFSLLYRKDSVLEEGGIRKISIEFTYDLNSGHVVYYLATTVTFNQFDDMVDSGNYSLRLDSTTVDLESFDDNSETITSFIFFPSVIVLLIIARAKRIKEG